MTVADDLRSAAVDVFDALTGVPVDATYIERNPSYVPGGAVVQDDTDHPIRIIIEDTDEGSLSAAADVDQDTMNAMIISAELPIVVDTKDQIRFSGSLWNILGATRDPVNAVTTISMVRQ